MKAKRGQKSPLEVVSPSESEGRTRPTAETRDQFIALRAEGKSQRECARLLGIGRSTSERWDKKYAAEIREQRVRDVEHFRSQLYRLRESRIEALERITQKCVQIVEQSDLVPVDTNQLMRIAQVALETMDRIRQETPAAAEETESMDYEGKLVAFMERVRGTDQAETFEKIMSHVTDCLVAQIGVERGLPLPKRDKPTEPPPDLPTPEEFLDRMLAKEREFRSSGIPWR